MNSTKKNSPKRKKTTTKSRKSRTRVTTTIDVRIDSKPCPLGQRRIRRIVTTALESVRAFGAVSIYLTGDSTIRKLNRKYLGRNRVTDVLAFPLDDESDEEACLGEVVVSVERALKRVKQLSRVVQKDTKTMKKSSFQKKMLESEIARYIIHGILHLAGYTDSDGQSAGQMHEWEDRILARSGFFLYPAID